jgi:hypothetical protein
MGRTSTQRAHARPGDGEDESRATDPQAQAATRLPHVRAADMVVAAGVLLGAVRGPVPLAQGVGGAIKARARVTRQVGV